MKLKNEFETENKMNHTYQLLVKNDTFLAKLS